MARIELETVFEFLRKNGLSECELALMRDVTDQTTKSKSNSRCEVSSDDEFFSLASSTDFTKFCGIHDTKRPISRSSSSERFSQFGSARDEHSDLDVQNDLLLYDNGDIIDCDFTEDKYIMSEHNGEEHFEDPNECYNNLSPEELQPTNYYALEENLEIEPFCVQSSVECICIEDYTFENPKATELCRSKESNPNEESGESDDEQGRISDDDELTIIERTKDDYETFELRIIHMKNRTGFEESKEFPIVLHSTIASRYYVTEFLGSSAFSRVVQAHDLNSGIDVCLKIIKNNKDFFDQSLNEIKLLKLINKHDPRDEHHILRLYDYFYHREHLFIVTQLLRANLYEFQKYNQDSCGEPYFTSHRIRVIARQCLEALSYLHDLGIIHCDLKPENILIKNYERCEVKIIDLGSSCFLDDDNLSVYVQSRSYRAPEVILGLPYDSKIDLWSLGTVLAELCSSEVLFPNEAVAMILARMSVLLGPIDVEMLQDGQETHKYYTKEYDLYHINEETSELEYIVIDEGETNTLEQHLCDDDSMFVDFLKKLLEINPKRRLSAREALQHAWLSRSYEV